MTNDKTNGASETHNIAPFSVPPTIDLQNTSEDDAIRQIAAACQDYGFFQIIHHSVAHDLIDAYLEQCRLYFQLPLSQKQQWKRHDGNARGWFNDELTKQKRDWKEALDVGVPGGSRDWNDDQDDSNKCLDGWNQFPPSTVLPDFRRVVTKYFDECAKLADRLAILMAKGLGVQNAEHSTMIQQLREQHSSYLRANYYPVCNEENDDNNNSDNDKPLGISPHRDAGFLTVLLQDADCHSLQVLKDDQWITIHPFDRYAFTINTGDMAEVWSNGRYQAPLHRVLTHDTHERYSTPFFYNPPYTARVEPLCAVENVDDDVSDEKKASNNNDQHQHDEQTVPPKYLGVLWGYFRAVRFAGDLTDLGVEIQVADFLTSNPSSHVAKQDIFEKEADFSVPFSVEKYRALLTDENENGKENTSSLKKNGKQINGVLSSSTLVTVFLAICFLLCISTPPMVVAAATRSSLVSRHPFNKERTGVSGFGSRSIRKTIFSSPVATATGNDEEEEMEEDSEMDVDGDAIDSSIETEENVAQETTEDMSDDEAMSANDYGDALSTTGSNKLWVQRSTDDSGVLWVLIGNDDDSKKTTLKLSVSQATGDWQVERKSPSRGFLKQHPVEQWVPIEGFYGLYRVPSGILWVLVSKTESVYSAPPLEDSPSSSWLDIRRIANLEIVHLSNGNVVNASPFQLREEIRQLKLLRKALKQHDFYYVPPSERGSQEGQPQLRDMTKTLQRSILEDDESEMSQTWWREEQNDEASGCQPDPRFFWNQHAVEPLVQRYQSSHKLSPKRKYMDVLLQNVFPVTSAFVGVQSNITVDESDRSAKKSSKKTKRDTRVNYDEVLISRRSRFRAGTRFTVRGADASGAVANFVETEQLCFATKVNDDGVRYLDSVGSHVQIRGSIPLRWSSPADVKTYRPRVRIGTDPVAQARALKLHLLEQLSLYSLEDVAGRSPNVADVVFVNLVDKKSDQGRLGKAFDEVLTAVMDVHGTVSNNATCEADKCLRPNSVEHLWYDFHAEVKDGRWDRLSMLLDELQPSLTSHGYFLAKAPIAESEDNDWTVKRVQNAIVRTNCMDCLDRTNVVQSIFGRYMLFQQLSAMAGAWFTEDSGNNKSNKKVWADHNSTYRNNAMALPWQNGEVSHRLLWADNADAISRLYAGTPALKGDFTRTGKRTKRGALDDGMNSLQRYYLNNFLDADRQEGYDLLVGYSNFSNVGEIPLEVEELIYQADEEEDSNSTQTDEAFQGRISRSRSLHEAARGKLLGDVVSGDSYQNRRDVQNRLQDIGVRDHASNEDDLDASLDLRWLPGDLQTHLRSQAEGASPSVEMDGESSMEATVEDASARRSGYDFQHALKIIDERSNQVLPWWAEPLDLRSDDRATFVSSSSSDNEDALQQPPNLLLNNPVLLSVVLILANKSPSALAGIALVMLSAVYLPSIVKSDLRQRSRIESLIAKLQKKEEEDEEDGSEEE